MMRTTLADMRATTERTIALIDATWAVLVAADDLLAQPISSAPQRRKADATRRRFERTVGDHSQTTTGAPSSSASRILT
jgi:hypothetical protein